MEVEPPRRGRQSPSGRRFAEGRGQHDLHLLPLLHPVVNEQTAVVAPGSFSARSGPGAFIWTPRGVERPLPCGAGPADAKQPLKVEQPLLSTNAAS